MKQNIFVETGFSDEDATVFALETDAAIAIARFIRQAFPNNQNGAARHLRIGQNEVSSILGGNIARFSLAKLIRIARRAGLRLFLDTGDTAVSAYATTLVPTLVESPAIVGKAGVSSDFLVDQPFETLSSKKAKTNTVASTRH